MLLSTTHKDALVLSSGLIGVCWLMDVFYIFYIKVFLDKFHLPAAYLNGVQILFLVWNAINDPIMGYMQDLGCCGMKWIMDRRLVVLYAGPFFAFSFLLFWFPWSTSIAWVTGLQLLVSLFIFDTLLTLCLSAYCGLCVEKSKRHSDRVRVTVYGELFGLLAGFMILPLESVTENLDRFGTFQLCCVGIAVVAAACMVFCGTQLSRDDEPKEGEDKAINGSDPPPSSDWRSVLSISWQIIREWRFVCLVGGQLFKILRFMANEQFMIIFVESLLVRHGFLQKGSVQLGLYYVAIRSLGSILFFCLWIPVNRFGCHRILQGINVISLINCALALIAGVENLPWIFAFILIENGLSRCGWQGYYMVIAGEVIDADRERHERKSPLSTIIFTMKALFNKPADQLAPIIVLSLLEVGGYSLNKQSCTLVDTVMDPAKHGNGTDSFAGASLLTSLNSSTSPADCALLDSTMFLTMVLFPACCAIGESVFIFWDQLIKKQQRESGKHQLDIDDDKL